MFNTPCLILKNSDRVIIQSFENSVDEISGKINVTGGEILIRVYVNVMNSWKKYFKNQFKTLIYVKNYEFNLKQVKRYVNFFFVANKSRYILYIYYILLYNNNNNNNKIYSDGKKDFFSQLQRKKKTFSLKNQRRLSNSLTVSVFGGI